MNNIGILKITTTRKQRSWVIFEEAGIFTRHALWRATTELRPQRLSTTTHSERCYDTNIRYDESSCKSARSRRTNGG